MSCRKTFWYDENSLSFGRPGDVVQGRTQWYEGPDQIQGDRDTFMASYNFQRTHQGYRVAGRTQARALYDLIANQCLLPPVSDAVEEVPLAS